MIQHDWSSQIQAAVFKTWQATGGKGVKIAVLDTGVDLAHPALAHLNLPGHKLNAATPGFDPTKPAQHGNGNVADAHQMRGHGTQCVSVISAKAAGQDALLGLAPNAEIFVVKVNTVDNKFFRVKDFLRGLEAAINLKVDIIVASLAYLPGDAALEGIPQAELDRVFGLLEQSGAKLLASLPNMLEGESWVGLAADNFPSLRSEAVSIGVVSQGILDERKAEIDAETGINFLVSNANGHFCKINGAYVSEAISSSTGTYLVAGIAALYLASLKNRLREAYRPLSKSAFVNGVGQRFIRLAEAQQLGPTPVFFKKTNANV